MSSFSNPDHSPNDHDPLSSSNRISGDFPASPWQKIVNGSYAEQFRRALEKADVETAALEAVNYYERYRKVVGVQHANEVRDLNEACRQALLMRDFPTAELLVDPLESALWRLNDKTGLEVVKSYFTLSRVYHHLDNSSAELRSLLLLVEYNDLSCRKRQAYVAEAMQIMAEIYIDLAQRSYDQQQDSNVPMGLRERYLTDARELVNWSKGVAKRLPNLRDELLMGADSLQQELDQL